MGAEVRSGNVTVKIDSVTYMSEISNRIYYGGESAVINYEKAAQGAIYVAIKWSYKNISTRPISAFSLPEIRLIDSNGAIYEPDLAASVAYAANVNPTEKVLSNLNPGIGTTSASAFEVNKILANKGLKIYVEGPDILFDIRRSSEVENHDNAVSNVEEGVEPHSAKMNTATTTNDETGVGEEASDTRWKITASGSVNVRSGPGIEFAIIGTVNNGDLVEVTEHKAGWIHINSGWINSEFADSDY